MQSLLVVCNLRSGRYLSMQLQSDVVQVGSAVRDSSGHASGCSGVDFRVAGRQCQKLHVVFVFYHCLIVRFLVLDSTLRFCMDVDKKVTSVLLDDMVGAVNFCCCDSRMVSGEGRVGDVADVSAGHAVNCV